MKLPNKVTSYKESTLNHLTFFLTILQKKRKIAVVDLYNEIKKKINSFEEFIDILTCLYTLNKIDFNEESEEIYYVI